MSGQIFVLKLIFLTACVVTILPLILIIIEHIIMFSGDKSIFDKLLEDK